MDTHDLKISRPCPIDLDVDRSQRQFFCDHCQKDVHVLANWSRAEAEAFLAANSGRSVCVSLLRDSSGELLYADSPARARPAQLVPVTRLRRRWLPEAAAAAGVAAALSACTPHELPHEDTRHPAVEEEFHVYPTASKGYLPEAPPTETALEGEIVIPKPQPNPTQRVERGRVRKPQTWPPDPAPKQAKAPKPDESEPCEPEPFLGGVEL